LSPAYAAAQAAWRFFANDAVTLPILAGPLLATAQEAMPVCCDRYVLVPLDWCNLHFCGHTAKADRVALSQESDLGYELLTALAVSDRDGSPMAPLCLEMRARDGVHSTRSDQLLKARAPLDALAAVMTHVTGVAAVADRTPVFIIDREADSVGHYRAWDRAGHRFAVRANDAPRVLHAGVRGRPLGEVADTLRPGMAAARTVEFKGTSGTQFVGETAVILKRPTRTHRVDKRTGKSRFTRKPAPPLTLRLIVSEIRDGKGKVLARWLILTNLPTTGPGAVDAATIALWYYWRWRIESYHKLLKGAGQQVECWQQESAGALVRRLLVAAMACVVVWKLARDTRPEAAELRTALVGLSGRQIARGKDSRGFTEPALLAGLELLVRMLTLLERHDLNDLRRLTEAVLPNLLPPAPRPPPGDV
jgi:hypothetical protein